MTAMAVIPKSPLACIAYYAELDDRTGDSVLLLEDLLGENTEDGHEQGGTGTSGSSGKWLQGDQLDGVTEETAVSFCLI